jgi:hypothetical protein
MKSSDRYFTSRQCLWNICHGRFNKEFEQSSLKVRSQHCDKRRVVFFALELFHDCKFNFNLNQICPAMWTAEYCVYIRCTFWVEGWRLRAKRWCPPIGYKLCYAANPFFDTVNKPLILWWIYFQTKIRVSYRSIFKSDVVLFKVNIFNVIFHPLGWSL